MPALRGALIEYGSDFLGPIPNVVIFQFNPETLTRNIEIPPRPSGTGSRETSQAGEVPVEKITLTAHFSAADQLNDNEFLARAFGVGHRLAALEKMVRPASSPLLGRVVDAIGSLLGGGGGEAEDTQPIPRESYPRLLFVWGRTRVLPVVVDSMSITEQEYDADLNPVRAEVSLGLSVVIPSVCTDDKIASGALDYSNLAKDAQAAANLAGTIAQAVDLVPDLIPF
jgi:hypothetical protein